MLQFLFTTTASSIYR